MRYYEQLAEQTCRVLKERRWSLRQAERNTDVGYSTIQSMSAGRRPGPELIAQWARRIGEDEVAWLHHAGYEILPVGVVQETRAEYRTGEERQLLDSFHAAPGNIREAILTLLRVSKRDGE